MADSELKVSGIFIGLGILVASTVLYPLPAWLVILLVGEALGSVGVHLSLVGQAGSIDPGAVLAASIYLIICMVVAKYLFRRKQSYIASTVAIGGCFCTVIVFALVSSIIWF